MVERLAIAPRVVDALVAPNLTLVAKGGGGAAMDDRVQGSGAVTVTESSNTYTRADMLYQLSPLLAQILYVATQSARNQVYVEYIQALPESVQHGIMLELEGVVASVVGDVRLVVTDLLMRFFAMLRSSLLSTFAICEYPARSSNRCSLTRAASRASHHLSRAVARMRYCMQLALFPHPGSRRCQCGPFTDHRGANDVARE